MPGIDGIFIGTGDLTLEMGLKFTADTCSDHQVSSDAIVQAIDRILKACQDNGKISGIVTLSAEDAARRINQGFQLVTCMNDLGFFASRTKAHLARVNELIEK
jgi:2-dehydro-3-deoxyglucarate aldolase/4-hydroxy-2-oxoheptanedioate aldolase